MLTNEQIVQAYAVVRDLVSDDVFLDLLRDSCMVDPVEQDPATYIAFEKKYGKNYLLAWGCSKFALVPYDGNLRYVIKFPANFEGMEDVRREPELFRKAVEVHLEECFAQSILATEVPVGIDEDGADICVPVVIMERADVDTDAVGNSCKELGITNEPEYCLTEDVLEMLSCIWGLNTYNRFTLFAKEYNINDLHPENIGYTDAGAIVCIDYSGYLD